MHKLLILFGFFVFFQSLPARSVNYLFKPDEDKAYLMSLYPILKKLELNDYYNSTPQIFKSDLRNKVIAKDNHMQYMMHISFDAEPEIPRIMSDLDLESYEGHCLLVIFSQPRNLFDPNDLEIEFDPNDLEIEFDSNGLEVEHVIFIGHKFSENDWSLFRIKTTYLPKTNKIDLSWNFLGLEGNKHAQDTPISRYHNNLQGFAPTLLENNATLMLKISNDKQNVEVCLKGKIIFCFDMNWTVEDFLLKLANYYYYYDVKIPAYKNDSCQLRKDRFLTEFSGDTLLENLPREAYYPQFPYDNPFLNVTKIILISWNNRNNS